MKATIEIADELYRRVKAKSALEGRAIREVTEELYRRYVEGTEGSGERPPEGAGDEAPTLPGGEPVPSWFGVLRHRARRVRRQDMESIRGSISAGIARERDL